MPKLSIVKDATSVLDEIFIQDSSETTGVGLTGLTSASSGLVCYRGRGDDGNAGGTAISLTSTGTLGTWASGWFKEKDATNLPGVYEIGYTNASLASGSRFVVIMFKGAANMAPCVLEIELTGWDNQDAVHGGMSALPNTAVTTNGSLLTSGTGTAQLSVASGNVTLTSGTISSIGTQITSDHGAGSYIRNTEPPAAVDIADQVMVRDWNTTVGAVGQPARRSLMSAARKLANKIDVTTNSGFLTVFREDDSTLAYSQAIVVSATAELITSTG